MPRERRELEQMLRLALAVVAAELGWMALGVVDSVMVGGLGAAALGGMGIARLVFMAVAVFGMGLLFGLDTLVSSSEGAGRPREGRRYLLHALILIAVVAPAMTAALWWAAPGLDRFEISAEVVQHAVPCLRAFSISLFPLLVFTALRRYLQGVGLARPVMFALLSANGVNVACNWALIYGHAGMPRLGSVGSPLATAIAVVYMASFLGVIAWFHFRRSAGGERLPWRPTTTHFRPLIALGLPAAGQMTLELSAFAAATALAGRLEARWVAAHYLGLTLASVSFMVPLGISAAGAVRVGHALGRGDARGARAAGWIALMLGVGFMGLAALVFLTIPELLLQGFTDDPAVIEAGISLLHVAAWFQLFDGLQVVATGVLRGAADTRTPLVLNVVGHWLLGLPIGYWSCFVAGRGAIGLWIGWLVGLAVTGLGLLYMWHRRSRSFAVGRPIAASRSDAVEGILPTAFSDGSESAVVSEPLQRQGSPSALHQDDHG